MTKGIQKRTIPISDLGSFPLDLQIFSLGQGGPRLQLNFGLHGDERSGYFVLIKLLETLRQKPFQGTLEWVAVANPLGQLLDIREEALTNRDLNRLAPGNVTGDLAQKLGHALYQWGKEADVFIDFHTLTMRTALLAIFMNHGTRTIREQSMQMIQAFQPALIWHLDTSSRMGNEWGGSFGPCLSQDQIVNFAVEMSQEEYVSQAEIQQAHDGLLRVMHKMGMLSEAPVSDTEPFSISYAPIKSKLTGLFQPDPELLSAIAAGKFPVIEAGQRLGQFTNLSDFETRTLEATASGRLSLLSGPGLLRAGDDMYNLVLAEPFQMLPGSVLALTRQFVCTGLELEVQEPLDKKAAELSILCREKGADPSICTMVFWLAQLAPNPANSVSWARRLLNALPDVDPETLSRILNLLNQSDDNTLESIVLKSFLAKE